MADFNADLGLPGAGFELPGGGLGLPGGGLGSDDLVWGRLCIGPLVRSEEICVEAG
jgi:hypothetical protein